MKTHPIIAVAILAASTLHAAGPEHKLPAALPKFKTPEQLAVWRKEMAHKAKTRARETPGTQKPGTNSAFYTGKPYLSESGTYAYKFRQYDPELNRWTTADPSGFPDGANSFVLGGNPVCGLDRLGLWYDSNYTATDALADFIVASAEANLLGAAGFSTAQSLADYSLSQDPDDYTGVGAYNNPATRLATSGETNALQNDSAFSDIFTTALFQGCSTNYSFTQVVSYSLQSDIGLAYGHVAYTVSGEIQQSGGEYNTHPLFIFDDRYDFNVSNPALSAFARLQFHDIALNYINSGEFFGSYSWSVE